MNNVLKARTSHTLQKGQSVLMLLQNKPSLFLPYLLLHIRQRLSGSLPVLLRHLNGIVCGCGHAVLHAGLLRNII